MKNKKWLRNIQVLRRTLKKLKIQWSSIKQKKLQEQFRQEMKMALNLMMEFVLYIYKIILLIQSCSDLSLGFPVQLQKNLGQNVFPTIFLLQVWRGLLDLYRSFLDHFYRSLSCLPAWPCTLHLHIHAFPHPVFPFFHLHTTKPPQPVSLQNITDTIASIPRI